MLRRLTPFLVAWLATGAARASPTSACIAAADRGQDLRDHRKLVAARQQFVACASDGCPTAIRKDCVAWQTDVESRLPSVVFVARDEKGQDLADVEVRLDGERIATALDGSSLSVDPGAHTVLFERRGSRAARLEIIVREGEKNRQLPVVMVAVGAGDRAVAPPPPEGPSPSPSESRTARPLVPSIALAAAGALVASGSVALGLTASSDVDDLRRTCAGHCPEDDVDDARRRLVIADVGIGLGLVTLGVAAYLMLTRSSSSAANVASFH